MGIILFLNNNNTTPHIFLWGGFLKAIEILAIIWLSLCTLTLLILHIKSHRLIKSVFLNAVFGFAAIAIINLTRSLTGVFVPLNWWTVAGSGVFGLPYVCGIILIQIMI